VATPAAITEAARRLARGELIIFPTETVYGIGADIRRIDAVERIFALKGRSESKPLSLHVSGTEMARSFVRDWPKRAQELTAKFWPGPLTLVVPRSDAVPSAVTRGLDTVGLRCPDHSDALTLIRELGAPIVGTSANPSGEPPALTAQEAADYFKGANLFALDASRCTSGIASTVLSLATEPPRILRQGALTPSQLGL